MTDKILKNFLNYKILNTKILTKNSIPNVDEKFDYRSQKSILEIAKKFYKNNYDEAIFVFE